jgi:hypothetical protein
VLVGERTRDEATAFLDAATSHLAPMVNTRLPG